MNKRSLATFVGKRQEMIRVIREEYGLDSPRVFSAMLQVPREKFAPKLYRLSSYSDGPISIGYGQTMSQPYTVAFMTHLLVGARGRGIGEWRILEVGTGSGYQAAILSLLAKEVYSIEIINDLAIKAQERLKKLGYKNVYVKAGSGEWGWPDKAPFDAILVTAGLHKEVPKALSEQLKVGGVLVAPIGEGYDKVMVRITKLKGLKAKDFKNPTSLKLRGAWEEFGIFHFVPFIEEKN